MAKEGKEKKKGGCLKIFLIIIIVIVAIGVIGGIAGGDKESATTDVAENTSADTEDSSENPDQGEAEEQITYTPCTVNDMMAALDTNALSASDTYKDKYLELTGTLGTIDSSGKYITLMPDDDFAIVGVQCYITDDSQLDIVKTLTTDSAVTVRGKCTDVGEVLGYSLDIDEIVTQQE